MTTLSANIQAVTNAFANVERMDPTGPAYKRLCAILDAADDDALVAVHRANIRFVSKLAWNRMYRRGLVKDWIPR